MRRLVWLWVGWWLVWAAATNSVAQNKAPAPASPAKKSTAAKNTTTAKKKTTTAKRRTRTRRRSYRAGQQKPAPERYAEIQRALADRGYFTGPTDGKWGEDSVEALKRFQADQNLKADGKLTSLSLIALGLGPRRSLPAQAAPPAEPAAPVVEPVEPPAPPPQ